METYFPVILTYHLILGTKREGKYSLAPVFSIWNLLQSKEINDIIGLEYPIDASWANLGRK